jgi:predicted nucleic-acid-binding protein
MPGKRRSGSDMAKSIIDANVILRYLLKDDERLFEKASAFLERVKVGEETVVIPESVLAECVYVLLKIYKVKRPVISEKLRGLFAYKGVINTDKRNLIDSLELFAQTRLSIVDCIVCSASLNSGIPLFTFDEDLKKAAKQ